MPSFNFAIINLGCKVNRVESDSLSAFLLAKGGSSSSLQEAQLVVINTCTVTGEAEKKTRKALRRAIRTTNEALIVVTGCAAAINPDFYENFDARVKVVPKGHLFSYLADRCKSEAKPDASEIPLVHENILAALDHDSIRVGELFPSRVGIKVQDGCNHACSYCIVHVARGRSISTNWQDIVREAQLLEEHGVKEIVLTGIDLGSYCYGDKHLRDLLTCLLQATQQVRFRISSIEPCSVDKCLIDFIAQSQGRICQHMHLPLQSGSDKVLSEMKRPYTSQYFVNLCNEIKSVMPNMSFSTDVIVGFPGETEKDFEDTCQLVKDIGFSKIHVFRYSQRDGTPAALRDDQIPPSVKLSRSHMLDKVGLNLRLAYAHNLIGQILSVVVEKKGWAMTESYYHIRVDDMYKPSSVARVLVKDVDERGVLYS